MTGYRNKPVPDTEMHRSLTAQAASATTQPGRRHFVGALAGSAALAIAGIPLRVFAYPFHQSWRVPEQSTVEIWPSRENMDLVTCVAAVEDWDVPASSALVMRLADETYRLSSTLKIRHNAGDRFRIVGNINAPQRCQLLWSGDADAIYVGAGSILYIDGVTICHGTTTQRGLASGVLADEGGVVECGRSVRVTDFYYGFQARRGGIIRCEYSQSSGAGDANYFAFMSGHISARGAVASGAADRDKQLGSGFVAEYGGSIDAIEATARGNALAGFTAVSNGSIRADRGLAEHNGRGGFYTDTGGEIVAHGATARANCGPALWIPNQRGAVVGNKMQSRDNNLSAEMCKASG